MPNRSRSFEHVTEGEFIMTIEVCDLHFTYPTGEEILKGINLKIDNLDPVAIIGQNGAGKTTLVKHLNGLLRSTSGDIFIDSENIIKKQTFELARTVGYVFQNPDNQLFLETVKKEFEFGPKQLKFSKKEISKRLKWVAEVVGLQNKLDVHPFDLSDTEKKFCTIGSVLMMNPRIIILDEPTCGQDIEGNLRLRKIVKILKQEGILCITISHDMSFVVDNFKRIIVLRKGKVLLDGTKSQVFKEVDKLASSFVKPPLITELGNKMGFDQQVFNVDEFIKIFEEEKKCQM